MMTRLWAGLLATSPLEALAVLLSLVYVVLAVPRNRWCWIAGGFGSLIYIWLFARAQLPMQSLLQVWYVGVAVFGFLRWSNDGATRISLMSWRDHVAGIAASLLLAMAIARFLAAETLAAWNIEAGILSTTNPTLSNNVDFFPGISLKWGFGHMINMTAGPDGRSAESLTWAGLLNTYYWIDPTKRVVAVFMTQVLPFADKPSLSLYRRFERGIYSAIKG